MARYVGRGLLMLVAVGIGSNLCCLIRGVQGATQPSFEPAYRNLLASSPADSNASVVTARAAAARRLGGSIRSAVAQSMYKPTTAVQPGASRSRYPGDTRRTTPKGVGLASQKEDPRQKEGEDVRTEHEETKTEKRSDEDKTGKGGDDATAAQLTGEEPITEKVTGENGESANKKGHKCTCDKHKTRGGDRHREPNSAGKGSEESKSSYKVDEEKSEETQAEKDEKLVLKPTEGGQQSSDIRGGRHMVVEPLIVPTYVKRGHNCTCDKHKTRAGDRHRQPDSAGKGSEGSKSSYKVDEEKSEETQAEKDEKLVLKPTEGGQQSSGVHDGRLMVEEPLIIPTYVPLLYTPSEGRTAE